MRHVVKAVLLGEYGCGKSCMLNCVRDGGKYSVVTQTIGVDVGIFDLGNAKLHVWDTAGQERFHAITENYMRGCARFVVCYDVSDARSMQHLRDWSYRASRYAERPSDIVIVGCKSDLPARTLSRDVEAWARDRKHVFYGTWSAKSGETGWFDMLRDDVKRTVPPHAAEDEDVPVPTSACC